MQVIEREKNLKDYLWDLLKFRWAAIAFFVVVLGGTLVYTFTSTPQYRAKTRIIIDKENSSGIDFNEIYAIDSNSKEFYQTQYSVLESRSVAQRVIDELSLWDNKELSFKKKGSDSSGDLDDYVLKMNKLKERELVTNRFLDRLKVLPIRGTRIVEILYISNDPELSARVVNEVVSVYMKHTIEEKLSSNIGTLEFLNEKIEEQRGKLEESEYLLQQYKEKYDLISLQDEEKITIAKLAELNSSILKVENERIDAESRYLQAKDNVVNITSIPEVLSNKFINSLKEEEAALMSEYSQLTKKFGKKHPHVISIEEQLRNIKDKISKEVQVVIEGLKNEYEIISAKEKLLRRTLVEVKSESQKISKHGVAYGVLSRDVDINREMYEIILTKMKETGISGGGQSTSVRVLDKAVPPTIASEPNHVSNLAIALILGVFGGLGFAFFLSYLDNSIKVPDDVERYLGIPFLGPVPGFKGSTGKDDRSLSLISYLDPKSSSSEAFRGLRTSILFSSQDENSTLLVTSSNPSEGKSIVSSNLAVTMAQNGARTLLVDVDFRRPMIHKIFQHSSSEMGFSNYLVGAAELDDIIVDTKIPNLQFIPCGHIPPNPAELLSSESMKMNLEILKDRYDRIIFDSPPVMSATDPVIMSTLVDEVVLVVMAGKSSREIVQTSIKKLLHVKANLLGAVLNNISEGRGSNYYYYYYYGESDNVKPSVFERLFSLFK